MCSSLQVTKHFYRVLMEQFPCAQLGTEVGLLINDRFPSAKLGFQAGLPRVHPDRMGHV